MSKFKFSVGPWNVHEGADQYGLAAEFVAPRLWMDPHTADGGYMSTSEKDREFAKWRL